MRGDGHQQGGAQPRAQRDLVRARGDVTEREEDDVLGAVAQARGALRADRLDAQAGRRDEHEPLDALRVLDRQLGADEAAHRVADDPRLVDVELLHQLVDRVGVAADRDLLGGHLGLAEAGQVDGDHAMVAGEEGNLLEPVLPAARQPVDEDHRRAGADVDDVHPAILDAHPAQVLLPVDVHPLRAADGAVRLGLFCASCHKATLPGVARCESCIERLHPRLERPHVGRGQPAGEHVELLVQPVLARSRRAARRASRRRRRG